MIITFFLPGETGWHIVTPNHAGQRTPLRPIIPDNGHCYAQSFRTTITVTLNHSGQRAPLRPIIPDNDHRYAQSYRTTDMVTLNHAGQRSPLRAIIRDNDSYAHGKAPCRLRQDGLDRKDSVRYFLSFAPADGIINCIAYEETPLHGRIRRHFPCRKRMHPWSPTSPAAT